MGRKRDLGAVTRELKGGTKSRRAGKQDRGGDGEGPSREGGVSVGPCGPLRVPEWVWRNLGGQGQGPTTRLIREKQSLSDFACVPHKLLFMSEYTCPCPCVFVHLCVSLSSVCISCPCAFVNTHTSGCVHISVHIPGHVCIHLSHRVPRSTSMFPCVSKYACLTMGLNTHECVWLC